MPAVGPPWSLSVDWTFGSTQTAARAWATWGDFYSTTLDVTADATWLSSSPDIVAVSAPGRFVSRAPGDAQVQVEFGGFTVSRHLRVYEGEPPWLVLEAGEILATIRDTSGRAVAGVTVDIIGGHNAGRTTVTDAFGWYRYLPPFVCGPVTARATKAGYREAIASSVMCVNGMPTLVIQPNE